MSRLYTELTPDTNAVRRRQDVLTIPFTTPPNELARWAVDEKDPLPLVNDPIGKGVRSVWAL